MKSTVICVPGVCSTMLASVIAGWTSTEQGTRPSTTAPATQPIQLPEAVASELNHDFPEARVREVVRVNKPDGAVLYRVELLNRYHQQRTLCVRSSWQVNLSRPTET